MLAIVDYGIGNLTSIRNMLKKAGASANICKSAEELSGATKLILPGMGHFDNCMKQFNQSGLRPLVEDMTFNRKTPVLGICVGLQMMMRSSEEGIEPGLAWIKGDTIRFKAENMNGSQKIPNMGWLDVKPQKESKLMNDLIDARFYFAHSYHVVTDEPADILLNSVYGYEYTVAIEHGNIYGVQFHPEKSHRFGLQLLRNFSAL